MGEKPPAFSRYDYCWHSVHVSETSPAHRGAGVPVRGGRRRRVRAGIGSDRGRRRDGHQPQRVGGDVRAAPSALPDRGSPQRRLRFELERFHVCAAHARQFRLRRRAPWQRPVRSSRNSRRRGDQRRRDAIRRREFYVRQPSHDRGQLRLELLLRASRSHRGRDRRGCSGDRRTGDRRGREHGHDDCATRALQRPSRR